MTLDMNKARTDEGAELRDVRKLMVGVSWDASARGKKGFLGRMSRKVGADLDLEAVVLDTRGAGIRKVGPGNLEVFDGALVHSGDSKDGRASGIDESITVDLDKLGKRADVEGLVFVVTAFKAGNSFRDADNIDVELFDLTSGSPVQLTVFSPPLDTPDNCILFAVVDRADDRNRWNVKIVQETVVTDQGGLIRKVGQLFSSATA